MFNHNARDYAPKAARRMLRALGAAVGLRTRSRRIAQSAAMWKIRRGERSVGRAMSVDLFDPSR